MHKKEHCDQMAAALLKWGVHAGSYHTGKSNKERSKIQDDWMEGRLPVICATIAFGMGIDKSNVRFVCHWTLPEVITINLWMDTCGEIHTLFFAHNLCFKLTIGPLS